MKRFWGPPLTLESARGLIKNLHQDDAMVDLQVEGLALAGVKSAGGEDATDV